jgi:hypothetical protein
MSIAVRLLVVAALVVVVVAVAVTYRRRRDADEALRERAAGGSAWPTLPAELVADGVACTWVIFTTPMCASCGQVQADLERAFPHPAVT